MPDPPTDRDIATRLTFFLDRVPYIRSANYVKGCDMAELHGNGWSMNRDSNKRMAPLGSWSDSKIDEPEPRNPIELHGSAYIAFCKPWAPMWVDPDEAADTD
jgi:hypothetical protein